MTLKYYSLVVVILMLSACATPSRYQQKNDSAPLYYQETASNDATPRYEPYRESNFKPYTVLGKHYTPLKTAQGYIEQGFASWYGQKFHGHLTSNGETYDMFAMTAAHKTLPLPAYVKVTNLDNGKTAIVRVNDRGPFHDNRIIDLSYAAAKKLGTLNNGVGRVKLEAIHVTENDQYQVGTGPLLTFNQYMGIDKIDTIAAKKSSEKPAWYIQVAALSNRERASSLSQGLGTLFQVPTQIPIMNDIFRLQLGPFENEDDAKSLLQEVRNQGFPAAYVVSE